jgi:hypothetical protein
MSDLLPPPPQSPCTDSTYGESVAVTLLNRCMASILESHQLHKQRQREDAGWDADNIFGIADPPGIRAPRSTARSLHMLSKATRGPALDCVTRVDLVKLYRLTCQETAAAYANFLGGLKHLKKLRIQFVRDACEHTTMERDGLARLLLALPTSTLHKVNDVVPSIAVMMDTKADCCSLSLVQTLMQMQNVQDFTVALTMDLAILLTMAERHLPALHTLRGLHKGLFGYSSSLPTVRRAHFSCNVTPALLAKVAMVFPNLEHLRTDLLEGCGEEEDSDDDDDDNEDGRGAKEDPLAGVVVPRLQILDVTGCLPLKVVTSLLKACPLLRRVQCLDTFDGFGGKRGVQVCGDEPMTALGDVCNRLDVETWDDLGLVLDHPRYCSTDDDEGGSDHSSIKLLPSWPDPFPAIRRITLGDDYLPADEDAADLRRCFPNVDHVTLMTAHTRLIPTARAILATLHRGGVVTHHTALELWIAPENLKDMFDDNSNDEDDSDGSLIEYLTAICKGILLGILNTVPSSLCVMIDKQ